MLIEHEFPADGDYVFTVKGMTGYFTAVLGNVKGEKLEVTVDGERVYLYDWDKEIGTKRRQRRPHAGDPDQGRLPQGRRHVHRHQRPAGHRAEPVVRSHDELAGLDLRLHVLPARRPGIHRRAVQRRRGHEHAEPRQDLRVLSRRAAPRKAECARKIVATLAGKAFRRPATEADIEEMMGFFEAGREEGGKLRLRHRGGGAAHPRGSGVHLSIAKSSRPASRRARPTRISDLELASRLSFFLWSSIPDEELIAACVAGPAARRRGARAASRADDCRPALGGVHRELHGAMAQRSRHAGQRARRGPVPGLRQHASRSLPARDRAVLRQHHSRGPQHPGLADGRLHVRQRAAREALRHSRRLRIAVPPRDAGHRSSTCGAGCSARARC